MENSVSAKRKKKLGFSKYFTNAFQETKTQKWKEVFSEDFGEEILNETFRLEPLHISPMIHIRELCMLYVK